MGIPKTIKEPFKPPKTIDEIKTDLIELGKRGEFENMSIDGLCAKLDLITKEWHNVDFHMEIAINELKREGLVKQTGLKFYVDVEHYEKDWGCQELPVKDIRVYNYISNVTHFFHNLFIPLNYSKSYGN